MGTRLLPTEEICVEMLKGGMRVKDILKKYNMKGTGNTTLENIAKKYNIKINRSRDKKVIPKKYANNYDYITLKSEYSKIDNYEVGQTVPLNGHKWLIEAINNDKKKLYHCVNELGFKESFTALDFRQIS